MTSIQSDLGISTARDALQVALPSLGNGLNQDQEWVVVEAEEGWQKVRLHDYDVMPAALETHPGSSGGLWLDRAWKPGA